jgi:hypothetical protein
MSPSSASNALDLLYSPDLSTGNFLECNEDSSRNEKLGIQTIEEESGGEGHIYLFFFFLMEDGT